MSREELIEMLNILLDNAKIGCADITVIKHVSFDSFKFVLVQTIQALSQEPCDDAISRDMALEKMADYVASGYADSAEDFEEYSRIICQLPSVTQKSGKWIPVSERLPENTYPVNITWVNHDPEPYYAIIKDKPFTATGCYCDGKWYWYSVTCQDYLDEYGHWDIDAMDDAIEVIAWMPLPEPYEPQESEDK